MRLLVCVAGELVYSSLEGVLCKELKGDTALPVVLGSAAVNKNLFRVRFSLFGISLAVSSTSQQNHIC